MTRALPVAAVLVGLPIAALGVAGTEAQTPLPVTAVLHHRYFLIGERECERALKKAEAHQEKAGDQLLSFAVVVRTESYPQDFRNDVAAGCQAAQR